MRGLCGEPCTCMQWGVEAEPEGLFRSVVLLSLWPGHHWRISLSLSQGGWKVDKAMAAVPQASEEEGKAQGRDVAVDWRGGAGDVRQRRRWHLTELGNRLRIWRDGEVGAVD